MAATFESLGLAACVGVRGSDLTKLQMESPQSGQKRNRELWEELLAGKELVDSTGYVPCTTSRAIGSPERIRRFPEVQDDDDHEEDDPVPCAHARVEPQFKPLSFYEQALWQQWHNKRERERRERQEKNDEEVNSRAFQLKNAKTYAQEVLDNAIEYANDRGAKHPISRDTLLAQHVSVQIQSLKADWAKDYDYSNELDNIGNSMDNIGNAVETLASAVEQIDIPHAFDCADGSMIASGAQRLADAMGTIATAMESRIF